MVADHDRTPVTRIDREQWLPDTYARVGSLVDLWREPRPGSERQTQAVAGEALRVLYPSDGPLLCVRSMSPAMSLVMRFDGTIGWVDPDKIRADAAISTPIPPPVRTMTPLEFLEAWRGVPYLWGGWSSAGVDCSGLTQLYFLATRGQVLPKNSRDQRRRSSIRPAAPLSEPLRDHDLVFCHRKGRDTHHVGIYLDGAVWHACLEEGVTRHELSVFDRLYETEAVGQWLSDR